MTDLIKIEDGKLAQQTVDYIVAVETQMKALKEQYDTFRDELQKAMEVYGIVKFESDNVKITYVAETTRETFDSKQFKADMPDLYNEYVKLSKVKACVKIKAE